jgi:signal transduction histidine kinase
MPHPFHAHRHAPAYRFRGRVRPWSMRRRLFLSFGMAILLTALGVGLLVALTSAPEGGRWRRELDRGERFVAGRFERVWDDALARDELARAVAHELDLGVSLKDATGAQLSRFGRPCERRGWDLLVERRGVVLGRVEICAEGRRFGAGAPRGRFVLWVGVGAAVLWAAAGRLSRRLTRPLAQLEEVALALGQGNLDQRFEVRREDPPEVRVVAEAVNDMAARLGRQLHDQRELLAAVSHELRTPLSRIRLLAELGQESGKAPAVALAEIDREVVELDTLVGQLLANSRIDFAALAKAPLQARAVAEAALARDGQTVTLEAPGPEVWLRADPTLLGRALQNLLENARRHGGGARVVRVRAIDPGPGGAGEVVFEVDDAGPGFPPDELPRAFVAFGKRTGPRPEGSLGLGLSLVRRIAEAHGGRAFAENLPGGGARVGFSVSRGAPS